MTTIQVQTAINPAILFRMYAAQSHQDMYGGGNSMAVSNRVGLRSFEGGAVYRPTGGSIPGFVEIPLAVDQSAAAHVVPPLDWYSSQYVKSLDDAKKERMKAEYAGFYDQWVRATLSNYK